MRTLSIASIFVVVSLFISSCGDQKKHTETAEETASEVKDEAPASEAKTESRSEIVNMTTEDFSALVNSQPFVVVDFYTTWCRPCIQMAPHLKKIADGYEENQFKLVKIDAEKNMALSTAEKITGYPTLKLYKNGKEVKTLLGGMDEAQLRALFAEYM